jgi:hypothetical protein
LFVLAVSLSCVFSLENPSNSWMWNVLFAYVQQLHDPSLLQAWVNMSAVQFSNCAHGGERPKQTTWRSTHDVYDHLAKPCPGDHVHKPYQVTKSFGAWTFEIPQPKVSIHGCCALAFAKLSIKSLPKVLTSHPPKSLY